MDVCAGWFIGLGARDGPIRCAGLGAGCRECLGWGLCGVAFWYQEN